VDREQFRRLPADVAVHRAGFALARGDVDATVVFARRAVDLAEDDDYLARGAASALLGLAAWWSGDVGLARTAYADCLLDFERIGHVSDVFACSIALADILLAQGRLREAFRAYEQALHVASRQGTRAIRGTGDMYVGLGALHVELDDLSSARRELARSAELGQPAALPQNAYRWRVTMARVCEADGDLAAAIDLLDEAARVYVGDFSPNVRPVPALRARAWLRQGRLDDAVAWVTQQGLSPTDDLSYLREFEHIALARVLMAQHGRQSGEAHLDKAVELLARLLQAAEAGARHGSVIEIRIAQALAHQLRDDVSQAVLSLQAALNLAEPEGYVRIFVDEGAAMASLLASAVDDGNTSPYVRRLRSALGAPDTTTSRTSAGSALVEPLSSRERDILRLLGTDLSGPEIARELVVSLNTVRTHTKNVYLKLGVNNRRAALRRAHELNLL
jgi:LuxR family maltose regulon positive regulatory protein